jgi:hypothetical protein
MIICLWGCLRYILSYTLRTYFLNWLQLSLFFFLVLRRWWSFVILRSSLFTTTICKCLDDLYKNWLTLLARNSDFLGKLLSVFCFAFDVCLRGENCKTVVKAVKLHKLCYDFRCKSRLGIFSKFSCKRILPVERAFPLFDLVLVVDRFEHAWSKLGPNLAENSICL